MNATKVGVSSKALGVVSLILGLLGAGLFWLAPLPMGFVLSLTGLMLGVIGWSFFWADHRAHGLLILGTLVSLAALVFNILVFHW